MGDRGNIVIEKDKDMFPAPLFLYSHWGGSGLMPVLQKALVKAKERWNDGSYAVRVIFQEMLGNDKGSSGFGISTAMGDSGNKLLCVNFGDQKVRKRKDPFNHESPVEQEWTFDEFCGLKIED